MDTFTRIRNIFFSGSHSFRGNNEPIQEISFLIDEGYLQEKMVVVSDKKAYVSLLENTTKLQKHDEAAGGSWEHIALKVLAQRYLQSRNMESTFEHPFCGYYPDVLSMDKKIVIECGHTQNAEKILTYFKQGLVAECIQVPYPDIDDESIVGYQFIPTGELNAFLNFMEADRGADIKRILNRDK